MINTVIFRGVSIVASAMVGVLLLACPVIAQDPGDRFFATELANPGDQPVGRLFTVRYSATLNRQEAKKRERDFGDGWGIVGAFRTEGPVEQGEEIGSDEQPKPQGDTHFEVQRFRCTGEGEATISLVNVDISYEILAGGGVIGFGDLRVKDRSVTFTCLPSPRDNGLPPEPTAEQAGVCYDQPAEANYGTFVARIRHVPGKTTFLVGESFTVHTEVKNSFVSGRFNKASWDLRGDLYVWIRDVGAPVVLPEKIKDGHPWLYVGAKDYPFTAQARFRCVRPGVAGIRHDIDIDWVDPKDPGGKRYAISIPCHVEPIKCVAPPPTDKPQQTADEDEKPQEKHARAKSEQADIPSDEVGIGIGVTPNVRPVHRKPDSKRLDEKKRRVHAKRKSRERERVRVKKRRKKHARKYSKRKKHYKRRSRAETRRRYLREKRRRLRGRRLERRRYRRQMRRERFRRKTNRHRQRRSRSRDGSLR